MAASRPKTGGSWLVPLAALWLAVVVPSVPAQQQLLESPVGRKISDVIPDGNKIRSTQHILAKMGTLAKGGVYDEKKANDAVAALLATGWFQPNGVHL
ncbi:MAG: hypothetical protein ABGY75_04485, partial [Gemmataceae bacterium]